MYGSGSKHKQKQHIFNRLTLGKMRREYMDNVERLKMEIEDFHEISDIREDFSKNKVKCIKFNYSVGVGHGYPEYEGFLQLKHNN